MALNRQTVSRNMDHRSAAGEGLEKSKEPVIRNWKNGDLSYVVAKNLAQFSPAVMRKTELVNIQPVI